ncbi:hypothetical protein G3580_13045 [Nitrogeniibacter mangrovi]|uniref:Copper resistance protein D domain-containing protein n=1 Tax=Nitrogeniibacter mangrovi TaxID=2016596 RepID=A0A6C1B6Q1_9RHOO|nr:CopD family protein [Nitrogeniibacter mangrovi]QID18475.1 hypothetical protein G3580_13045 [Nitrogeniibacter mangrovi]
MPHAVLLFAHLCAAIVWVGGMFFAYACLRPAAAQVLEPPQRLGLWVATFRRFFRIVAVALVFLLGSGFSMFPAGGLANAPHGWLAMMTLGLVMTGVFAYIYGVVYPALARHTDAGEWPAAAARLNRIRQLVAFNLVLSVLVIASAASAR